jgi:two-component system C4-dicarboxylate transport response regulator DctD
MSGPFVRLIDDDADLLAAQTQALKIAGFRPEPFTSAARALEGLSADYPGVILSDVRMPGMDGFELHRRVQALDPDLPVILLTGHGDVPMAVAALKAGAWDFLTKPTGSEALAAALRRAAQARALVMENRALRAVTASAEDELSGTSPAMVHLRQTIARVAEAGVDALILGPMGAGKLAVARALHRQSARRARAFVHVVCPALDPARFEAELFGQPAPSARDARLPGLLEKAHRGTLFLDRIDLLPEALQIRLTALIGAESFTPAGAAAPRALDLRLFASSASDLARLAAEGRFWPELLYRLSGISLTVPPLVARREDVLPLFRHFLLGSCRRMGLPLPQISASRLAHLGTHDWPGNLRELQQFAEATALGLRAPPTPEAESGGLTARVAAYEAELLRAALRASGGSVTKAMESLELPRKTLYDKLSRHGIDPAAFRPGSDVEK